DRAVRQLLAADERGGGGILDPAPRGALVLRAEDAPAHAEGEHGAVLGDHAAEERSLVRRSDRCPRLAPVARGQDRSRLAEDEQAPFAQLEDHVEVLVVLADLAPGP